MRSFSFKSFMLGVVSAVVIAALLFLFYYYLPIGVRTTRPDSMAAMKKVGEIERLIRSRYIEEIDESTQTDAMLTGLVSGLEDTYAEYYTRTEYEEVKRQNAGVTRGIGISISQDAETGELVVVYVVPDSPAEQAGVLENDVLLTINGEEMTGKSSSEAAQKIQALEETIILTLLRAGEDDPILCTMEKGEIKGTAVSSGMLEDQIGYIGIQTFNGLTAEQFAEAYTTLQKEGMRALVIDLRNNLGGLVTACCDTVGQILPAGVIVYEQDRTGKERMQENKEDSAIDLPLVLLVNRYTASASEIFTGAVRDYDLATIVGERTYGKGIEQNTYTLSDGSALKLTTTVYYTPNHEDINGIGITPDVVVELPEGAETDLQLERAIEILTVAAG